MAVLMFLLITTTMGLNMTNLECIEINPDVKSQMAVIWLHGLGADGHDFVDIVPQLHLPNDLPIKFIFPHAPERAVTINNGYIMRAWYDIKQLNGSLQEEDEIGIRDSAKKINALIEREKSLGLPSNKIILAGFSQGGAMALHTGLRYPEKLAGIIALSSYLPLNKLLMQEKTAANQDVPIMMAHGTEDPLIPVIFAKASKDFLIQQGYQVAWHTYPMPHTVCAQEVNDIGQWLQKR
jgi:phospholipase/carboxylesterase